MIAIDGKTSRRSSKKGGLVSAFAARQRLMVGQVKVAEKSNEIVAIPRLLERLQLSQAVQEISLRYRVFIAEVWDDEISVSVRLPHRSGKQFSSRRETAEAAIKSATHKFLTSRLAI